jgi:three-Cys-motif partner protein
VEFYGDAIVLSGETGTKLKCEILKRYYPTWWRITSGNESRNFSNPTAIVEMNAGTCLDYIKETDETILGSSGHAMNLKFENDNPTSKLKIVLVESDSECFGHLEHVIRDRWPQCDVDATKLPHPENKTGVYLIQNDLRSAIEQLETSPLGNSLFFFDPLLFTPWNEIERVAKQRIHSYYHTGTEFIVFLFTSDWFKGRKSLNLDPLPDTQKEDGWTKDQRATVRNMESLFGTNTWRETLLASGSDELRMERLVTMYRRRLHKWFRYVLPFPFAPKDDQTYHLFMCTNFEGGIGITKRFYTKETHNVAYDFDVDEAYHKFKALHPETMRELTGLRRPAEWKCLRRIIKDHDEGLCDMRCEDLSAEVPDWDERLRVFRWLEAEGYLRTISPLTDVWDKVPVLSKIDWSVVEKRLEIPRPPGLGPLIPSMLEIYRQFDDNSTD